MALQDLALRSGSYTPLQTCQRAPPPPRPRCRSLRRSHCSSESPAPLTSSTRSPARSSAKTCRPSDVSQNQREFPHGPVQT
eukprot:3626296-Rhodomonas_salina.1